MSRAVLLAVLCSYLGCRSLAYAQRLSFGKCPTYKTVLNFDAKKFEGKWYEVERSFYLLELTSSCTTMQFTAKSGGLKVAVKSINRWTGSPSLSLGTASASNSNKAVLKYQVHSKLPTGVARMLPGAGVYSVLHTDYDNYAVIWSCSDMGFMHADLVWVLGRTQELPVWARAEVYNRLQELKMDPDRLTLSSHKDCPNY